MVPATKNRGKPPNPGPNSGLGLPQSSSQVESSSSKPSGAQRLGRRVQSSEKPPLIKKQRLKCMYTNLDGINNKVDELQSVIGRENPDLICLTETKANDSILSSNVFDMSRFKVYRKDRPTPVGAGTWGGGVAILVRADVVSDDVYVDLLNKHRAEEGVWCEVALRGGKKLILGSVYRAPSSTHDKQRTDLRTNEVRATFRGQSNSGVWGLQLWVHFVGRKHGRYRRIQCRTIK